MVLVRVVLVRVVAVVEVIVVVVSLFMIVATCGLAPVIETAPIV